MDDSIEIIEDKHSTEAGVTVIKRYQKGRFLGKGGFAKCYEIKDTDNGKMFAVKIIEKSTITKTRTKQKLLSEIKIHRAMKHSNIVNFERYIEDEHRHYFILELCPNQTMKELLKRRKRLHEIEAQCFMMQLVTGVKYLHSHKVIHRDLKLGNLFLAPPFLSSSSGKLHCSFLIWSVFLSVVSNLPLITV